MNLTNAAIYAYMYITEHEKSAWWKISPFFPPSLTLPRDGKLRPRGKSRIMAAWTEFVGHVASRYLELCKTASAAFTQAYTDATSPENIAALCEEWNMEFHEDGREFEPNEEIAA
jgi:hypothetical protein